MRLDGVVVVVDAGNLGRELDEPRGEELAAAAIGADDNATVRAEAEKMPCDHDDDRGGDSAVHETVAHLQLSSADSIIVNKTDTVTSAQLSSIEARIRSINGVAKLTRTTYSRVERLEGVVVELNAYDTFVPERRRAHAHLDPVQSFLPLFPFFPPNSHHISPLLPIFPTTSRCVCTRVCIRLIKPSIQPDNHDPHHPPAPTLPFPTRQARAMAAATTMGEPSPLTPHLPPPLPLIRRV